MLGVQDLRDILAPKHVDVKEAPYYEVPPKKLVAIDHPSCILNLDNGLKSFGSNPNFHKLINENPDHITTPLWLQPGNALSKPIISHSTPTNNILFKITVPKRTGRKRKRGSFEPFSGNVDSPDPAGNDRGHVRVSSVARLDRPHSILRKLKDNPNSFKIETMGSIRNTQRYRGLADYQFSGPELPFLAKVAENLTDLDYSKIRDFKLDPSLNTGQGQEIIPPPNFTDKVAPFVYEYEQNPNLRPGDIDEEGNQTMVNIQRNIARAYGQYISYNTYPVPSKPSKTVGQIDYEITPGLLNKLKEAFEERPIWTRRALMNRVGASHNDFSMKLAIGHHGYQFRGGPWRDTVVRYGVDPRSDPKYRKYQSVAFQLHHLPRDKLIRDGQIFDLTQQDVKNSHMWDGKSYCTNGKFWQICDITDPALLQMIEEAPVREDCEIAEGGYLHAGTIAKIKSFMKTKMIAIQAGRLGHVDDDPRKEGYIYDSTLIRQLAEHPHIYPSNVRPPIFITSLLYGLEDVDGLQHIRYKRRAIHDFRNPFSAMGFGRVPWKKRNRRQDSEIDEIRDEEYDSDVPGEEDLDEAWKHILDSDLDENDETVENIVGADIQLPLLAGGEGEVGADDMDISDSDSDSESDSEDEDEEDGDENEDEDEGDDEDEGNDEDEDDAEGYDSDVPGEEGYDSDVPGEEEQYGPLY